ncbi:SIMPL domain-containing protein [Dactylosporangium siamense]|uniref:SIMPL domain-containing protein n=1 Tax=Dactylosporangium siamense TaxID=685454 RepID=A0A919PZX1_9ACTN|nr:SIMPL domain-containing protein [Dactylosporangium siamense]GIG51788.1 SIMPL domain-containing protein [Dactylosporangium siamense]
MQMIGRPWGVTAYGAASVKALPDLVRVRFKIVNREQTPSAAFDAASAAVSAVRTALRSQGVADSAVKASRLNLATSTEYIDGAHRFAGYRCVAAFSVESTDLDGVQRLLVDLVAAGANEIDGVDFDVTTKRELRAEARRKAVAAARAKAELYAEAAGVRLGAVLHIEDVDVDGHGQERYKSGHSYASDAAADQDLAPGHVIVNAAVTLGFAISHD